MPALHLIKFNIVTPKIIVEGKKKENIGCILNSEKVQELQNGTRGTPIRCVTGHSDKRWILNGCDLTSLWAGTIDEIYLANLLGFILIPLSQNYCYLCHKIKSKKDELVKIKKIKKTLPVIHMENESKNIFLNDLMKHKVKYRKQTRQRW